MTTVVLSYQTQRLVGAGSFSSSGFINRPNCSPKVAVPLALLPTPFLPLGWDSRTCWDETFPFASWANFQLIDYSLLLHGRENSSWYLSPVLVGNNPIPVQLWVRKLKCVSEMWKQTGNGAIDWGHWSEYHKVNPLGSGGESNNHVCGGVSRHLVWSLSN